MSSWMTKLFSTGAGSFLTKVGDVADRFIQTKDEKAEFSLELEKLLQARDSELEQTMRAELGMKERVMIAELQSGDNYTRRARPTVVYFGLLVIALNYTIIPLITFLGADAPQIFELPAEFWFAWGGVVSVWSAGRTMERRGAQNNMLELVTGKAPTTGTSLLGP